MVASSTRKQESGNREQKNPTPIPSLGGGLKEGELLFSSASCFPNGM
jgi:hypothetical protein